MKTKLKKGNQETDFMSGKITLPNSRIKPNQNIKIYKERKHKNSNVLTAKTLVRSKTIASTLTLQCFTTELYEIMQAVSQWIW